MNLNGDIFLIEDDADDREFLTEAFNYVIKQNNYHNKLVVIGDSSEAIERIKKSGKKPFLVLSDINMPKVNGFELRSRIFEDPELREGCIPYIFITTAGENEQYIKEAYQLSVQGYFAKPEKYPEYKILAQDILKYWKSAKVPQKDKFKSAG